MLRPAALAFAVLALAACDTDDPGPLTYQGVDVVASGAAALEVRGGALVVSGLDGSREGGFTVGGQPDRVDVEIDPLAIPAGGRFGVEVEDADGATLAALYNEAGADGRIDFQFDFPSVLGVTVAVVRYRLDGELRFEGRIDVAPGRSRSQRRATSGGSGSGSTGSTHVIRENGRYIVVSDSDEEGGRRGSGCPGFLMTPPPPLDREVEGAICADWVEVEPVLAGPMPRGVVTVAARGVGSFTVRELDAR